MVYTKKKDSKSKLKTNKKLSLSKKTQKRQHGKNKKRRTQKGKGKPYNGLHLTTYVFFDDNQPENLTNLKDIGVTHELPRVNVAHKNRNKIKNQSSKIDRLSFYKVNSLEHNRVSREQIQEYWNSKEADKENPIIKLALEKYDTKTRIRLPSGISREFKISSAFSEFDPLNSLTPEFIETIIEQIDPKKRYVFFWDWDRTITLEEGLWPYTDKQYGIFGNPESRNKFLRNEISNNHDDTLYTLLDKSVEKFPELVRNWMTKNTSGIFTFRQYVDFLLGGKSRVEALAKLFKQPNVKHCIISNNKSFYLYDPLSCILLTRAIFKSIGLTLEENNNILMIHTGQKALRYNGITKQNFIEKVTSRELIPPKPISNLSTLTDHRINQLINFISEGIKERALNLNAPRRTVSAPAPAPIYVPEIVLPKNKNNNAGKHNNEVERI